MGAARAVVLKSCRGELLTMCIPSICEHMPAAACPPSSGADPAGRPNSIGIDKRLPSTACSAGSAMCQMPTSTAADAS